MLEVDPVAHLSVEDKKVLMAGSEETYVREPVKLSKRDGLQQLIAQTLKATSVFLDDERQTILKDLDNIPKVDPSKTLRRSGRKKVTTKQSRAKPLSGDAQQIHNCAKESQQVHVRERVRKEFGTYCQ